MEDATISQLRKKPYTQNIAPHPEFANIAPSEWINFASEYCNF
jgi:hypothetical protein